MKRSWVWDSLPWAGEIMKCEGLGIEQMGLQGVKALLRLEQVGILWFGATRLGKEALLGLDQVGIQFEVLL